MGSLVGHLYPRLVRLALRVRENKETKERNVEYESGADIRIRRGIRSVTVVVAVSLRWASCRSRIARRILTLGSRANEFSTAQSKAGSSEMTRGMKVSNELNERRPRCQPATLKTKGRTAGWRRSPRGDAAHARADLKHLTNRA